MGTDGEFSAWLAVLGSRIAHAHIQVLGPDNRRDSLKNHRELVRTRLHALFAAGYAGSFTLEFTAGVGLPDEDLPTETLWRNTLEDLQELRAALGRD
jgi:hypothetical protein